jgi:hypothetical protein
MCAIESLPDRGCISEDSLVVGGHSGPVSNLAAKFLTHPDYDRKFFQLLLRAARGQAGESWPVRCFALVLMERQLSKLNPHNLAEFDHVLGNLGLKKPGENSVAADLIGSKARMPLADFVPQLLRKINRRSSVQDFKKQPDADLAYLLHRSNQECKLVLAPCIFRPKEVFKQILQQVKVSKGIPLPQTSLEKGSVNPLAKYESQIFFKLLRSNGVYWVSDATNSRINSLVEYPLGAVVLVLKLPGSDLEIEFKRAGKRERPLDVLFARGDDFVPVSHRLQGGGTGWILQNELDNERRFCSLFRAIHQSEPPWSRTSLITNIRRIPCKSGNADLLTWFTDEETFGTGYQEMRLSLRRCVKSSGHPVPEGTLAQTVAFLQAVQPRQSIVVGTSSFRLDRLCEYLSPVGPQSYFREGLGIKWTHNDARHFADDLLEEILGGYVQPDSAYRTHEQYLKEAFSIPENRAAANANYLFCMGQIGLVWGTMLALGSYSIGESFVPRNVGLKAAWQEGSWRVKIIFMDHDSLESPGPNQITFHAANVIAGTIHDETHIFGYALPHRKNMGAVTCLQDIYRVTKPLAREGHRHLRSAMRRAFCKTRERAPSTGLLSSAYLAQMVDFDEVVRMSINPRLADAWETQATSWLNAKGYTEKQSLEYQETVKKYARFFREHAFLYELPSDTQTELS